MKLHGNARLTPGSAAVAVSTSRRGAVGRSRTRLRRRGSASGARMCGWRRWRAGDRSLEDRSSAPKRIANRTPCAGRGDDRAVASVADDEHRRSPRSSRWRSRRWVRCWRGSGCIACRGSSRPSHRTGIAGVIPASSSISTSRRLGRFRRPGHRVTGRAAAGSDAHRRERVGSAATSRSMTPAASRTSRSSRTRPPRRRVGFLERAIAWFADQGVTVQRIMTDNGPNYRSKLHARTDPTARDQASVHAAVSAAHQRQSRAVHPNHAARMGLRRRLPNQRTPRPSTRTVARLLQSPTTPRRPRSPSPATRLPAAA